MTKKLNPGSLTVKLFVLAGLLVLTTIPRMYAEGIINDRKRYELDAVNSVVSGWAARHEIGQVKFDVPYHRIVYDKKTKESERIDGWASIAPANLTMTIKDQIEIRQRGIFKVPIYKADLVMKGEFSLPKDIDVGNNDEILTQNSQRVLFQIPKSAAVSDFQFELDGKPAKLKRTGEGLLLLLTEKTYQPGEKVVFSLKARLNGHEGLDIRTAAQDELEVLMTSAWPHPSFTGQLPVDQKIGPDGFTARWKLVQPEPGQRISVNYIEPINIYSQANRALKYGFLLALLCLSILFLMETLTGLKIHGMQYLLMTLPLSCFYVLLIALSEHIGFFAAYAVATASVIGLIYLYFSGIGARRAQSSGLVGILTVVYGLILTMLSSEDYALLIGAIFLFVCMSAFMLMTRKVNWSTEIARREIQSEPT